MHFYCRGFDCLLLSFILSLFLLSGLCPYSFISCFFFVFICFSLFIPSFLYSVGMFVFGLSLFCHSYCLSLTHCIHFALPFYLYLLYLTFFVSSPFFSFRFLSVSVCRIALCSSLHGFFQLCSISHND